MTGIIQAAPGGLSTLSGGTRTAVKTERPWQVRLKVSETHASCPLCSRQQLDEHFPADGWKTFRNSNTPWPYHRLLIPTNCWPIDKLWSLGGKETVLAGMLQLAIDDVLRTRQQQLYPIWIYTHIGYGAGQNFAHHHWHITSPADKPKPLIIPDDAVKLWDNKRLNTYLCGVRAGQALIVQKKRMRFSDYLANNLAEESSRLVEIFNKKFCKPDYCLFFAFHSEMEWYARYTPILNNWGGSEFAALDVGTPFVLPWPHEATRDFLLGRT
ncbi:MAG TPA: hypothetical protein VMV71_02045 [Candidatus Paceibacterota bacterium]|nr:hypothetical protein [Candidatus Paceibacterota bacterium]